MGYSAKVISDQAAVYLAIERLPYIPAQFRERQIARIIRDLYPSLHLWSRRWSMSAGDIGFRHREDAVQVAALAVLKLLRAHAAGTGPKSVRQWGPYLNRVCRYAVSAWYKGPEVTAVAGQMGQQRRNAGIPRIVRALRSELGRHPTAAEVVEHGNRDVRNRIKDPVKSGSLLTIVDVEPYIS